MGYSVFSLHTVYYNVLTVSSRGVRPVFLDSKYLSYILTVISILVILAN